MIVVFASWDGRIAPVFDVATEITVVEVEDGEVVGRQLKQVAPGPPLSRAQAVLSTGCEVLVCGAISRPMQAMIAGQGVRVIGFITGELDRVIEGWLYDGLDARAFIMPGCGPRRRRRGQGGGQHRPSDVTIAQGQGRRRRAGGRMEETVNGQFGPHGHCICPQCGYRESHRPGTPCSAVTCPRCGSHMTRERENNNF